MAATLCGRHRSCDAGHQGDLEWQTPCGLVIAADPAKFRSAVGRYSKISTTKINDLVDAVPMPETCCG